jgi:hypothetical protein
MENTEAERSAKLYIRCIYERCFSFLEPFWRILLQSYKKYLKDKILFFAKII